MKRIQDSVHGLMEFRGMECVAVDILRAPELQRLRRIRQLGLVNLVYPGAEHSRFTHSLGAASVMKRFANALVDATSDYLPRSLQPDEEVVRDLVVAALCHDLGHGPLSHVWEQQVVHAFDKRQLFRGFGLEDQELEHYPWLVDPHTKWGWHELITQAILLGEGELNSMLEAIEKGMAPRIASLLAGQFYFPYLAGAFASDVDADRCDFVLRDAIQSGVAHGRFDLDWLVSTIAVGDHSGVPKLGFDRRKAPRVIEQLLVARRALYAIVYHHQAVRAAEGMVGRLLRRIRQVAQASPDAPPITGFDTFWDALAGKPLSLKQIIELDEDGLWIFLRRIGEQADPQAPEFRLWDMLRRRQLFKPVQLQPKQVVDLALTRAEGDGEGWSEIDAILRKAGYDPPDHFRFLDETTFKFFHEGPPGEGSWLIDLTDRRRPATPVREEDSLVHHQARRAVSRLYVPLDVEAAITEAWNRVG